ncbi:Pheromone-regulated membrane protein 10 [Psilocybe cubensis]|uniref:Pheromone-regulated membrane protein 10 n=2 Tax=Psilocybe cubensis TaxID=181762 RepID=A0A8H7Y782_PSICU|nr:Pheromone-regulated membrane protein 10 [Psilocybe cubensis]KAH9486583.1 Pheromone-regulated membrane protein 10 [Psilocybe cubensis]
MTFYFSITLNITNRELFATGFEPLSAIWRGLWRQYFETFFSFVCPPKTAKKPIYNHKKYRRSVPGDDLSDYENLDSLTDIETRRKFILKLGKALLTFGAPSHRIESQLLAASNILDARAEFIHLPNIIIVSVRNEDPHSTRTYFIRSRGRIALTSLHKVHEIYRDVLHDHIGAEAGTDALRQVLRSPAIYSLKLRCFFAFLCASIICGLSFGGSLADMWISGACASFLQYLGLNAANKSSMYANVYEISVSIVVAFIARALSNLPGDMFCYSAISSAGVVVILPGFTVLISALELMSKNIFCGSVRIVYAIIYTLFLGFGLTIGSDFYLVIDRHARREYYRSAIPDNLIYIHGHFSGLNGTKSPVSTNGVLGLGLATTGNAPDHTIKGCIRLPMWPFWRQPLPWWTLFFLVPIYSTCSSLSNLQYWRSLQLPLMVLFSCCAYAANRAASLVLPGRTDIVSAAGAFVIGTLGNIYSRVVRGTAFTSMVTGVLFLVPSGIAQGGGVTQTYHSSAEQYSSGFSLALRMITVAAGVTIGLFVSQVIVYLFGTRKNAAHFAF